MTGGQIKTKAMGKKAFKKTQPTSALLPKSFKDFSKKLKAYKDIERKVNQPSYKIKSKGGGASTGGGSSYKGGGRKINKKFKSNTPNPSAGGGGGKPPKPPKPPGGSIVPPSGGSGGVDPETVNKIPKKPKITGDTFDNLSKGSKYKTFKQFGKEVDTAPGRKAFDARKVKRMSKLRYKGLGGKPSIQPVRRVLKPAAKALVGAAKRNPKTALIGGALALGAAYFGGKALTGRPGYDKNKIRQTGIIKDKSGQNVQFKYGDEKNPASPVLTKDYLDRNKKSKTYGKMLPGSLTKFRTGAYTAKDTKSGLNINIDKNMKGSAFEKQLQRAEKGTGFLGRQTSTDRTFLKKYKNATRPGTK